MLIVLKNEPTAALRRMYFHCVDATDGMTPETGEAGGQPQISAGGAAWGNTSGVLVAIGNGRYYVELTQTEVNIADKSVIEGRYKSANTAEAVGTTIQVLEFVPDALVSKVAPSTWDNDKVPIRKITSRNISDGDDIAREQTLNGSIAKGLIQRRTLIEDTDVLEIIRGDVWSIPINLGSEESWVDKKVYFIVKKVKNASNTTAIVNREITVTDAANRIGTITLTSTETLVIGNYYSEIEVRDLSDENPRTDYEGKVRIKQDIRQ